ncbi:DUF1203 domain-containing protein [Phenylobacterium sp.]|uniref:DUF1203 domain-containing protein n=1 Tax=Phenylobacterium sp. TaxID=1871053 RepID=UPI003562AD9D
MSFVVSGLSPEPFRPLFGLSDAALAEQGVIRRTVDVSPGFPCRVSLEDAAPGETVLLLNYEHQSADTPFRARHAIFVRESAQDATVTEDELPPVFEARIMSLRAFDEAGMMRTAAVAQGAELKPAIERLLAEPEVAYLHAHYAGMGCYAARIDRA